MLFKDARKDYVEIGMALADSSEGYPEDFLIHAAYIICTKGYDIEKVKQSLPAAELIKEDSESLLDYEIKTRCYFGCIPISYQYFECYLEDPSLEGQLEQPYYYAYGSRLDATFTKTQFLASIGKAKEQDEAKPMIKTLKTK